MIPVGVAIYVALEPIDLRFSFDRLSGLAKERVGYDARSGAMFIFYGRRRDALKVLFFDGSGMCVFYKRLGTPWKGGMWNVNLRRRKKEGTPISLRRSSPSGGDPWSDTRGDEVRR
jgi:hypothetical protein